jgi:tRNA(Ile)-lysidine synthase
LQTPRIVARVDRAIEEALIKANLGSGKTIVVAVSGGQDSLALLYALSRLKEKFCIRVHGAHLDHGLRGRASAQDAKFVEKIFNTLDVEFTSEKSDVDTFRHRQGMSVEEAARNVRYTFLSRVVSCSKAVGVFLGHTLDDQAETIMMNIIRGAGIQGLKGMDENSCRTIGGRPLRVIRPLLSVTREETSKYCRILGLQPRDDETNKATEFTRNWIRLKLFPEIRQRNPAIREALVRLSEVARENLFHLDAEARVIWREVVQEDNDGNLILEHKAFTRLDPALQAHILRTAFTKVAGGDVCLEQVHLNDSRSLMCPPAGRILSLPGGVRLETGYGTTTIFSENAHRPTRNFIKEQQLIIPGETKIAGWTVLSRITNLNNEEVLSESGLEFQPRTGQKTALLDFNAVGNRVHFRGRRPGDRFQPLGMCESKKLQDFMVDSKIPRDLRDTIPLIDSPNGIAWVAGLRIAEWAKLQLTTEKVLRIDLKPER